MSDKKVVLTISILASNRKDTLPKTLESIKPILDKVSSELIVTDTGCDEELLEVIKRYTDNIIKFQWCKDFSKARNEGLKLAKGQWFMYLDDDEWFEDVTPIIDFFNNGEYLRYNAFDYFQRNYLNMQGTVWNDAPVGRATKLTEDMTFVGVIHEHFSKPLQPIKIMDAYVHHYGYVFEDEHKHREHAMRNLSLLEKQMEEGNHSLRTYFHMLQEYNGLGDYEKAYDIAMQGLKMAEQTGERHEKYISAIKTNVAYSLYGMRRDEEALAWLQDKLKNDRLTLSARGAMNSYLACVYFNVGNAAGVVEATLEFLGIYRYLCGNTTQMSYESVLAVASAYMVSMRSTVFNMALMCAVLEDSHEDVENILNYARFAGVCRATDRGEWLSELVEHMRNSSKPDIYGTVLAGYMDDMLCATKICNKLMDIREVDEASFMRLTNVLIHTGIENPYIKMLRTIHSGLSGND